VIVALAAIVAVAAALRGMWSPCGLSMMSSINPMSEQARGQRFGVTVSCYVVGSVVGSAIPALVAALGAVAVAGLDPSPGSVAVLAASAALVAALSDSRIVSWHLPVHPRQVNEDWLTRYRGWVYGFGFGAQIGAGFATYIMTAGVYLMVVLAALSGSPAVAAGVVLLFGLVRGLSILPSFTYRSFDDMARHHRWLDRHAAGSLRSMALLQVGIALVAAAVAGPVVLALVAVAVAVIGAAARLVHPRRGERVATEVLA
jgi:hypothetical protein